MAAHQLDFGFLLGLCFEASLTNLPLPALPN